MEQPQRTWTEREIAAQRIAERLDRPIGILGIVALGVWLLEPLTQEQEQLSFVVEIVWLFIAVAFLVEFSARLVAAPATWLYLRTHWWELGLVVLPFLRFLRALRAGRAGRGLVSAVRSSRRAAEKLRSRLTLLLVITALVVCSAGRSLFEYGGYGSYPDALHDSAMSTLTGAVLGASEPFGQCLEILLAGYSAVIMATVAGALGAYFLEARATTARLN